MSPLHAAHASAQLHQLHQRTLTAEDLGEVLALHLRCTHGLAQGLVRSESLQSLQRLLDCSQFLGLFHESQLVAYSVLQQALEPHEKLPPHIAADVLRPQLSLSGMAVAPKWRGLGLQRRLIMQRIALAPSQALLFSTAAPGNWYSWNNLLACGFHTRELSDQYDGYEGHWRYLMVLEPLPKSALYPDLSQELHMLDIKRQQALLGQGWRGAQPGHSPEYMRYVPIPGLKREVAA